MQTFALSQKSNKHIISNPLKVSLYKNAALFFRKLINIFYKL